MSPDAASPLTLLDLFCGAGGATRGFVPRLGWPETSMPFRALGGVDFDDVAAKTYSWNFPDALAVRADLTHLGYDEIRGLMRQFGTRTLGLDVLVACPPCQSYSRNNRGRAANDARNWLYLPVIDWIRMLRPRAVLMENVGELRDTDAGAHDGAILRAFQDLNYVSTAWTIDVAAYGVPQHRIRRFHLAYRADVGTTPVLPPATHHAADGLFAPSWVTAGEAIDDLPAVASSGGGWASFTSRADPDSRHFVRKHGPFAAMMRSPRGSAVTHHWSPPLSDIALRRLRALGPGEALHQLPKDLQPKMGFRGAYGRVARDRPAWTITGNCEYPSRGRFSHYSLDRGLTMREAARLQSFPDEFRLAGTRTDVARQIGNALPPLMARAFAVEIARVLAGEPAEELELATATSI